jgi:elongator complex protein 3
MLKPLQNEVRKPTRSISGIVPVAVMLPPKKCLHGTCLYCPNLDVPQSYTPKSPVVIRAREVGYDSYKQVKARLKAFEAMHHPTDKVEIIIMGGTFLEYEKDFQYEFIKGCYDALNGKKSKNLEQAKKINETAKSRCIALCIETRPDVCIKYIPRLLEFGCTRVELGVQMPSDDIYKKIERGHKVKDVVDATRELKNAGFKVGYHIMPGLPLSGLKKDLQIFKKIFSDEKFKPDQLKIYPCQVIKGSKLEELYYKRKYKPYTKEETEQILISMLKLVPRYCRVMRVMREIPPDYLIAGTTRIDLRKDVEAELRKNDSKIKEIRYREVGFNQQELDLNLKLKITKYKASGGDEYFLEIVNKDDILFGLLRLRIANKDAIIRELHVYGKALKLGEEGKSSQHTGLGKWLMEEAEKIVKKNKIEELRIISGVGVREYYKKLGYELEKEYMVKKL